MEHQNVLGIYLGTGWATVVCSGPGGKVLGSFVVEADSQDQEKFNSLASAISAGCAQKQLEFGSVSIGIDCSLYMQHKLQSEFSDYRKIAQTIRFDAEEALATDVSDVAIAFRIMARHENGADLTVFTTQKELLESILRAFASFGMDPVAIEPDVVCLGRYIGKDAVADSVNTIFVVISGSRCYLLFCDEAGVEKPFYVRTFLLAGGQGLDGLLGREIPMSLGVLGDFAAQRVYMAGQGAQVDCQALSERLGLSVERLELPAAVENTEDVDTADMAGAFGAALFVAGGSEGVNFRDDFSPYQGRKRRLEKAAKFASIAVTILLLAVGVYGQSQFWHRSRPLSRLREKYSQDYSQVMMGASLPSRPISTLESTERRIQSVRRGQLSMTGQEGITARLALLLEAFNRCAGATRLEIDSISIISRHMVVTGSTASRQNTLRLRRELQQAGLEITRENSQQRGTRDSFTLTLEPEEG